MGGTWACVRCGLWNTMMELPGDALALELAASRLDTVSWNAACSQNTSAAFWGKVRDAAVPMVSQAQQSEEFHWRATVPPQRLTEDTNSRVSCHCFSTQLDCWLHVLTTVGSLAQHRAHGRGGPLNYAMRRLSLWGHWCPLCERSFSGSSKLPQPIGMFSCSGKLNRGRRHSPRAL